MGERQEIGRRQFVRRSAGAAAAGAVLPLAPGSGPASAETSSSRRRLVLVGTGSRGSHMWGKALMQTHAEHVELVGLCDINRKRVEYARGYIGVDVPTYPAGDFDKMIHDTKPDAVMVTTPDCFHADYVVRALDLGCDAISEKPLTTEVEQCRAILEAEKRSGRRVSTTFNARHGKRQRGDQEGPGVRRARPDHLRRVPGVPGRAARCQLFPAVARQEALFRGPSWCTRPRTTSTR